MRETTTTDRRSRRAAGRAGLLLAATLAAGLAVTRPAAAVVVLDSTWREEGGAKGREAEGFGAHLRLAAEPQFRAVLALATDGESWGEASATWIGNDERHAYLLTAGHVFELPARADAYVVRGPRGEVLKADRVWVHPGWNGDNDTRTGYDLAILRLTRPVDGLGTPPALYGGGEEAGKLVTFVGYGNRGIGSKGEKDAYYSGSAKAAAQGIVDQWVDIVRPRPRDDDGGNYIGVFLPKEDGSIANPYGGSRRPVNRMVGLLGAGDSGGSTWMRLGKRWVIVAVNGNGTGKARYGDSSWMARVSPHRDWIVGIFPGAVFADR